MSLLQRISHLLPGARAHALQTQSLADKIARLSAAKTKLEGKTDRLKNKISRLQSQYAALSGEFAASNAAWSLRVEALNARISRLMEDVEVLPGQFPVRPKLLGHQPGMDVAALAEDSLAGRCQLASFFSIDPPPGRAPLQDSVDFMQEFNRRLPFGFEGYGGMISPCDGVFIDAMISILRPSRVLEIGVAFGYSSCCILASMRRLGLLDDAHPGLVSLDIETGVPTWADPATPWGHREVGALVGEFFPDLSPHWDLRLQNSSLDLEPGMLGRDSGPIMALVDAAHWHPWPLVDVCRLLEILPPGSWILMQDVALPVRHLYSSILWNVPCIVGDCGAQHVMENWPGRKIHGIGGCFNMAALEVPEDKSTAFQALETLLHYPDEPSPMAETEEPARARLEHYLKSTFPAHPR